MLLKEPKQVKAVESRQSAVARDRKFWSGSVEALCAYWRDKTTNDDEVCHCPYFSINDFLSFVFGEYNK